MIIYIYIYIYTQGCSQTFKMFGTHQKKKNAFHLEWKKWKSLERYNKKQYFSCIYFKYCNILKFIPGLLSHYFWFLAGFLLKRYKPIHFFAQLIFCFKNYVSYRCFKRILTAKNLKHKINRPRINNKILRYDFFLVINKFFLLFLSKFFYLFD